MIDAVGTSVGTWYDWYAKQERLICHLNWYDIHTTDRVMRYTGVQGRCVFACTVWLAKVFSNKVLVSNECNLKMATLS